MVSCQNQVQRTLTCVYAPNPTISFHDLGCTIYRDMMVFMHEVRATDVPHHWSTTCYSYFFYRTSSNSSIHLVPTTDRPQLLFRPHAWRYVEKIAKLSNSAPSFYSDALSFLCTTYRRLFSRCGYMWQHMPCTASSCQIKHNHELLPFVQWGIFKHGKRLGYITFVFLGTFVSN